MRTKHSPVRAAWAGLFAAALLAAGWQVFKRPDPDVKRGNRLIKKGQADKALTAYEKAEKRLGRRHELDYNRGLAYFGLGQYKKARESFLTATGATAEGLRKKAFYNLANSLFKLAEPTLRPAAEVQAKFRAAEAQLAELAEPDKKQQRCQIMQVALKLAEEGEKKHQAALQAFGRARSEYRQVLVRDPEHFKAKWNLELSLRHLAAIKAARKRLAEAARKLKERFEKECQQDKKKDDKQQKNQDDKQQKDQDKNQDDKQQKNKDKNKNQDDKQQKDQDKNQDKSQKPREPPQDPMQKPLTKEDIAKRRAGRELDKLERRQRDRDRRRARSRSPSSPDKDW